MSEPTTPSLPGGVTPLTHLGVIQVVGEDAAKFIHGQLTHDFSLLGLGAARLAAFCNAKGRMQASFIGMKRPDGSLLLVCSADLLATTLKRLSMFVLRAKACLHDASAEFALYGVAAAATVSSAGQAQVPWTKVDVGETSVVNLYPACGVARQLWIQPVVSAAPQGEILPEPLWAWSEVRSGIATVTAPVFEAFVPQMLNYESVDGVNFKKGCYPGQEVVARSQFRGTIKRRAFVVHADAALTVGAEIFSSVDPQQPVGIVVQSAAAPQGGCDAIISAQIAGMHDANLHAGTSDGPILQVLPLPYALREDI